MVLRSNHCCNLVWQQNRHQKVSIGELYSTFVQWGLTFWNLNKHHCFIVPRISIWEGDWSFVWRDKPTKGPPWWLDCVAKLQLAFQSNWLGKVFRLCNMSSLQEKICQSFCLQAWKGPKWYNAFKCLLCFEAKPVVGLFWLHLNTIGWSSHMTSMTRRDNWLGFRSLWSVFRIRVYGQVLDLGVQCLVLGLSLQLTYCKQEAASCLPSLKQWQTSSMHGTELLQMSWSTKQDMRSKLVVWLLQPIVFR